MARETPLTDVTRDMPALTRRAVVRPGSVNPEKRTAEVIWTTGARVLRGFWDKYYEELSLDPSSVRMGRLNNGAPLLNAHDGFDARSVIGVVESAKLDGKQGTATVRFAKAADDADADAIFRKVQDGIIQNVSVGYRIYKLEKIEDGAETIPVMRATDWEPYELSVVPMGADDGAGFRASDRAPNPCVFVAQPEEKRTMETPVNPTPPAAAAAPAAAPAPEDASRSAEVAATERAAKAELELGIRQLVRRAKLGDAFADELVKTSLTLDAARVAVLDKLAAADEQVRTVQHLGAEITDDAADRFQRGGAAWLFQKAMVADRLRDAQKAQPTNEAFKSIELDPGEFRGFSLLDLARSSLERHGVKTRGMDKMTLVARAFTYRGGYNTTSDFAVLLENVMHKTLLSAYATTPDTWSRFCAVRSASDFRAQNYYRNGSFGVLDGLNEHGEFKSKAIPDGEKSSFSVGTKGNIIALSRQAVVNDDMGAFSDLASRVGRAAKFSIEVDVYALIALNSGLGPNQADTHPLFYSTRFGTMNLF